MFDIGWGELLVIAVVAIVVIGPKDLPAALRAFGRFTGKMKRMAREFQGQFNEALREAELDDIQRQVKDIGRIDPLADLRKDLTKTQSDIRTSLDKAADPEMKQLASDKGTDEPAPALEPAEPKPAVATPGAAADAKP